MKVVTQHIINALVSAKVSHRFMIMTKVNMFQFRIQILAVIARMPVGGAEITVRMKQRANNVTNSSVHVAMFVQQAYLITVGGNTCFLQM